MRIAIVTGALGGIGKETALHLGRFGYAVVGMDVVENPDLFDFNGLDFTYVKGNLADATSRSSLVEIAEKKGDIAVLVKARRIARHL